MKPADILAHRLFELADVPWAPPVPVESLAQRLGVDRITFVDLLEDGSLERHGSATQILIRRDLHEARRRFTIAHELAHLMLTFREARAVAYRTIRNSNDVERFCDEIAAAVLFPRWWMQRHYARRIHNLSTIRHLAHQTGTSMGAAVVRLSEVLGWTESLLRFRFDDGRWRFVAGAAVPAGLHGHVRTLKTTGGRLEELATKTRRDVRSTLPLLVNQRDVLVTGQLSVCVPSAMMLAQLSAYRTHNPRIDPR
jgi:hypothetical protein